ncbi:LysR substrate-binding domain-containing protein (plasmid) [Shinella yambaruensis]|uniref:LysR substrate-binding domain-containing protein n=1 Tax=Shinella yambaruensis TaxID=415996 RepID=UPI003D7B7182
MQKTYVMRKFDFMQKLRFKLPPPNLLISFEAAGRHLSFTKAATELNVSRVAVSQQMQALEKFLGVLLFHRLQRAVKLTRVGERYHLAIADALERALRATAEISRRSESNIVNVGTTPGFMTYWLSPRLGEFRTLHPDIELRFIVSDGNLGFEDNIDVVIRYGVPPFEGAEATFLARQAIGPTCASSFLPEGTVLSPRDLLDHPLINLEGPYDEHTRWSTWFRVQGIDMGKVKAGITVNSYTNLVQAALEGQGFALIGPPLIERFLSNGTLIQPVSAPLVIRHAFHLLAPQNSTPPIAAEAFATWVKAAFPQLKISGEEAIEVDEG